MVWCGHLLRKPHSWLSVDSKQCREQCFSPLSCFPQSIGATLLPSELLSSCMRLLLDRDTYVGVDPLGVFPLFPKKVADIIAPIVSIIFLKLIHLGSFPECWQSANVTSIPKGAPSPDRENY